MTEISINTPIEKVWKTLVNFEDYKNWNPFIIDIKGDAKFGQFPTVTIKPPNKKNMKFKPKIICVIENHELKWLGRLFIPGLFDGEHRFLLKKIADGKTHFLHSECFTGILQKPILKLIMESTRAGFELMNFALKKYCEMEEII